VLLALLALLSAFTPLSIDMYLPALPIITVDLHGTAGDIQLTLSAFMIAFGLGQIFYGPAGDRFGRRPVILGGLCVLCADVDRLRLRGRGDAAGPAAPLPGAGGLRRRRASPARWCAISPRRIMPRAPCR